MTDPEHNPTVPPHGVISKARGVIDPAWEDELRHGQTAEGEAGSVEAELALLHLLRHVRQPDTLQPEQLDSLWSAIEAEVAPAAPPWWRKTWLWWSAPALAAVAVLAVIITDTDKSEDSIARTDDKKADSKQESAPAAAPAEEEAGAIGAGGGDALRFSAGDQQASAPGATGAADAKSAKRGSGSNAFETSFEQLAPHGRRAIRGSVDTSLDDLRGQLLADARGITP
jgi:hypothetical protein